MVKLELHPITISTPPLSNSDKGGPFCCSTPPSTSPTSHLPSNNNNNDSSSTSIILPPSLPHLLYRPSPPSSSSSSLSSPLITLANNTDTIPISSTMDDMTMMMMMDPMFCSPSPLYVPHPPLHFYSYPSYYYTNINTNTNTNYYYPFAIVNHQHPPSPTYYHYHHHPPQISASVFPSQLQQQPHSYNIINGDSQYDPPSSPDHHVQPPSSAPLSDYRSGYGTIRKDKRRRSFPIKRSFYIRRNDNNRLTPAKPEKNKQVWKPKQKPKPKPKPKVNHNPISLLSSGSVSQSHLPQPQPPPSLPSHMAGCTTVMVKNIPNSLSRRALIDLLDRHCREHNSKLDDANPCQYDFLYLPFDFRHQQNMGYAFVNFTTIEGATTLYNSWGGRGWQNSSKVREITRARLQGLGNCKKHYQFSTFFCRSEEYLPVEFLPPRDGFNAGACHMTTIGKWVHRGKEVVPALPQANPTGRVKRFVPPRLSH